MKGESICSFVKNEKCYNSLKGTLIVLTIISIVGTLGVLVSSFCVECSELKKSLLELSNTGVMLFQGFAMLLTLLVAAKTYITSKHIENVKGLAQIREMLTSPMNMKVHKAINHFASKSKFCDSKKKESDNSESDNFSNYQSFCNFYNANTEEVDNYFGTLELAKIYLDERVIDEESFYHQFGYRVENAEPIIDEFRSRDEDFLWLDLFRLQDKIPNLRKLTKQKYEEYKQNNKNN